MVAVKSVSPLKCKPSYYSYSFLKNLMNNFMFSKLAQRGSPRRGYPSIMMALSASPPRTNRPRLEVPPLENETRFVCALTAEPDYILCCAFKIFHVQFLSIN